MMLGLNGSEGQISGGKIRGEDELRVRGEIEGGRSTQEFRVNFRG